MRSVEEAFAAQVRRSPDALAIVGDGPPLRYRDLDSRANHLAHCLRAAGLEPGEVIGVSLPRSSAAIVTMLAVLKAGGAYLPLDGGQPYAWRSTLLAKAGVTVTLDASVLDALYGEREDAPEHDSGGDRIACVMQTSGTTGSPRAVAVLHASVLELVLGADYALLADRQTILQLAPLSFDASTFEIWGALLHGGCVAIAPPDPTLGDIADAFGRLRVTASWLTAGLFHQLVEHQLMALARLGVVLTGGDVVSPDHVNRLLAVTQGRVVNGYGPTETTTFACCHVVRASIPPGASVPIGRPVRGTRAYVVDERGCQATTGELWIGGAGVSGGYLGDDAQTATRFTPDPFDGRPGQRVFRTGDRVRWRLDGELDFLGRSDRQVKVRGHRVEPDTVEAALRQHPAVADACVEAWPTPGGDKLLIAHFAATASSAAPPNPSLLCAFLRERLPSSMIPAHFLAWRDLPLGPHGKIDRAALADRTRVALASDPRPSPDEVEPGVPESFGGDDPMLVASISQIFADVLGAGGSADSDFFALGGDSLVALSLFARIESTLGARLPLTTIFDAPTPAALARRVGDAGVARGGPLVVLRVDGARPPLVCVHGLGGEVYGWSAVAALLDRERPVVALRGLGLYGDEASPVRIEEYAARYLDELRRVRSHGPYAIAGYSSGGVIAFEMARRLAASGERVETLILVDAETPPAAFPRDGDASRDLQTGFAPPLSGPYHRARLCFMTAQMTAFLSYLPSAYHGKAMLLRSLARGANCDPALGWRRFIADLDVDSIPGDHDTLFNHAHIGALAEALNRVLHGSSRS